MSAVLIAEPEPGVRGFLERHLAQDGFDVIGTDGREAAQELASRAHPDLVLLGDPSALDAFIGVPVIVIGRRQSDAIDRVRAFASGCDDFVARPFVYDELLARMNAVLRRAKPAEPNGCWPARSRSSTSPAASVSTARASTSQARSTSCS